MGMLEYDPEKRLTAKEVAFCCDLQSADCVFLQKLQARVSVQFLVV